jgi:hypothetical protein
VPVVLVTSESIVRILMRDLVKPAQVAATSLVLTAMPALALLAKVVLKGVFDKAVVLAPLELAPNASRHSTRLSPATPQSALTVLI